MTRAAMEKKWLVVAAMDFGTTYSRYAFSFRDSPTEFHHPQTWYAGSSTLFSNQVPTCLLLNPDSSFNSYGYEAQDSYAALASKEEHEDYYYFFNFKMELHHSKSLTRNTQITDLNDKQLPALTVFSLSIKYLKDHLMSTLNNRLPDATLTDVRFVLTVPAIWTDAAKQFMREAAIQAGIDSARLILALKPEAASLYCKEIPSDKLLSGKWLAIASAGTRYVLADLGGGTSDFSVHEKQHDGTVIEIHRPSGDAYGGIYVDKRYKEMIEKMLGKETLERLRKEEMEDYLTFFREFEVRKRTVDNNISKTYTIRLTAALKEFADENNKNLKNAIENCRSSGKITYFRDRIKVDGSFMIDLFRDSINNITVHLKYLIDKFPDIESIILVGGYAECPLLQQTIKEQFKDKRIIIPNECSLAVVKGAVLFGHFPYAISARILRYSYGTNTDFRFENDKHDKDRMYTDGYGILRCHGTFDPIISAGTLVSASGKQEKLVSVPLEKNQLEIETTIFYSQKDNVMYTDEENCKQLGKPITIELPRHIKKPTVEEEFTFGMTELQYTAKIIQQDVVVKTVVEKLDLLE